MSETEKTKNEAALEQQFSDDVASEEEIIEGGDSNEEGDEEDPAFIEIHLDENELTQSMYMKVVDYSDFEDEQEQYEVWEGLINNLKEIVGG